VEFACHNAESLVPSYADGELSEEQAAPLRRHLLECVSCREAVQSEQALKRWFADDGEVLSPPGFAARVARRAFAGDTGILADEPTPVGRPEGAVLSFVLQLTAVAAAVLLVLALAIRSERLPEDSDLSAEEPYTQVLEELERLNEAEGPESTGETEATGEAREAPEAEPGG
jgi:anti-sigma factor RsiW